MKLKAGAHTDIGTRKNVNQDACGLRVVEDGMAESAFAVVCDGIGGMSEGEIASGVVVRAFLEWFERHMTELFVGGLTDEEIFSQWRETAQKANSRILSYARQKGRNIGTTATVLLLSRGRAAAMNIGDTRLYCVEEQALRQVTKDHTLVQQEVEAGILTPEEARVDKRKNILVRCLGAEEQIAPDFYSGEVHPQMVYLLCTDGLRNVLEEEELRQGLTPERVRKGENLSGLLRKLTETVKERGEKDNITSVALYVENVLEDMERTVDMEGTISLRWSWERIRSEADKLWMEPPQEETP